MSTRKQLATYLFLSFALVLCIMAEVFSIIMCISDWHWLGAVFTWLIALLLWCWLAPVANWRVDR